MTRNLLILAALIALTLGYTVLSDRSLPQQTPPRKDKDIAPQAQPAPGQAAPDFAFETLAGQKRRLSDYQGKVIVLNFWASWCAPCVAEFPQLLDLAAAFPDRMVLLAVSADHDPAAMKRFVAGLEKSRRDQKNVVIAWDSDKSVTRDIFQTTRLPETILIDSGFVMREKIAGVMEWNGEDMHRKIADLYSVK